LAKAWPALDIHVPGCDPQLADLVLAELDDYHPTAIHEPDDTAILRAFFSVAESRDAAAHALARAFGAHLFIESVDIEDEDWAARSQSQLRAITVGRITVAPPWDVPEQGTRSLLVVIRPSMGFGTGHHATTRLMLRALQALDLRECSVLDIGCGSGVLAFAAAQLGARVALGIDIDPDALRSANDNLALNPAADVVRFEAADLCEITTASDVVLANLTGGMLERFASKLAELVRPGGHLIVSGFMEGETAVLSAFGRQLSTVGVDREDEWMCGTLQKSDEL
jgi:ribosomal protein L11 methyltransferase